MARREKRAKDQWDRVPDQIDFTGRTQEEVLVPNGLIKPLTGRILPRVLECEMDISPGYPKHDPVGDDCGDSRNRYPPKTVLTENQEAGIPIPRDRKGTFEPHIVAKPQRRVPLVNDQSISLYATDRDINAHLEKLYQGAVSPEVISRVTAGVMEEGSDSSPRSGGTGRLKNALSSGIGRRSGYRRRRRGTRHQKRVCGLGSAF